MRAILFIPATILLTAPAWAQRGVDEVVIPPAKITISPDHFAPGQQITIDVSFRQGIAFAPIAGFGCASPGQTGTTPCDDTRTLGINLWHDDAAGARATAALAGAGETWSPPQFYTLVTRSYPGITVPAVPVGDYLTVELVFVDRTLVTNGGVNVTTTEVPRVLGMRRFKWGCRPGKKQVPAKCGYKEVQT